MQSFTYIHKHIYYNIWSVVAAYKTMVKMWVGMLFPFIKPLKLKYTYKSYVHVRMRCKIDNENKTNIRKNSLTARRGDAMRCTYSIHSIYVFTHSFRSFVSFVLKRRITLQSFTLYLTFFCLFRFLLIFTFSTVMNVFIVWYTITCNCPLWIYIIEKKRRVLR